MKKSLAFVLVLALVFGSVGFAFAGSVSGGIETAYQTKDYLKIQYVGQEDIQKNITYDGIDMTGYDFVVVKQGTSLIVWTSSNLDNTERATFIDDLEDYDKNVASLGIPEKKDRTYNFTDNTGNKWESTGSGPLGSYYFMIPGNDIQISYSDATTSPGLESHFYALADGVSHYILGNFGEIPTYDVEYTINKNVVVSGGAFTEETFDFNVHVSALSDSAIKTDDFARQITIEPGEDSDTAKFDLSGLKAEEFPLRLEFSEKNVSEDGWSCDNSKYSVDVTLNNGVVTYGPLVKPGDASFVSTGENEVIFINYYDGDYQLQFPIQKIATISSGAFTSKTFDFKAELVSGASISDTKSITINSDGSNSLSGSGILELSVQTLPAVVKITEATTTGQGWVCDGSKYMVLAQDNNNDGVVEYTYNGEQRLWSVATFNNIYAGPDEYTFPIEITKNLLDVPDKKDLGDLTFEFRIIVKDKNENTILTTKAATTFATPYSTSKNINLNLTASATDFPCNVTITETTESMVIGDGFSGINSDDSVFEALVEITEFDKAEVTAVELDDVVLLDKTIAFTNKYWGKSKETNLEIPVHKEGTVDKGSFNNQKFDFEVYVASGTAVQNVNLNDLMDLDYIKLDKTASVTLAYPSAMSGETELTFTTKELSGYSDLHSPIILKILEKNGKANYWTYDNTAYYVQIENNDDEWDWEIIASGNQFSENSEIIFQNTYNYTGGQGTQNDTKNDTKPPIVTIEDNEIPLIDDPGSNIDEVSIPEAEIPLTGGLGTLAFLMIGGATTALGMGMRKNEKRQRIKDEK